MTRPISRKSSRRLRGATSRAAGGSATGGGINFQGAITAISLIHMARGIPLGWLEGVVDDTPVSVLAETGGAGDDIALILRDGSRTEVQIKRGLTAGPRLWEPLLSMCRALADGKLDYAVLIVSADSSGTIRNGLARDIRRLGGGRRDGSKDLAESFIKKLDEAGIAPESVCGRLRIAAMSCAPDDSASIAAARAELAHICADSLQVGNAWDRLYREGIGLIDLRGQRDASGVLHVLRSASIAVRVDENGEGPVSFLAKLSEWVIATNADFTVLGVNTPLPLDTAWLELRMFAQSDLNNSPADLASALALYHDWGDRMPRNSENYDPTTVARFKPLCVVVAGPGMGKSTLLKKLARSYGRDGLPVLKVRLRDVAARMSRGEGFDEALFALALDSSGIPPQLLRSKGISDWVLLCDGLDECGTAQELVAGALVNFVSSSPHCRVIATTRPIGYSTALLRSWRHYELLPLDSDKPAQNLEKMLAGLIPDDRERRAEVLAFANAQFDKSKAAKSVITRSPLLLGFALSLALRGTDLGKSKTQLYERLFRLIDEAPNTRISEPHPPASTLRRFLEVAAWDLWCHPLSVLPQTLSRVAESLCTELGVSHLSAQATCESSIDYWEARGLLEKVHHAGDDTLTFIHKTFGEFAAARYLAALPPGDQITEVKKLFDDHNAAELLTFAGALGAGPTIAREIVAVLNKQDPDSRLVCQAVALMDEMTSPSDAPVRKVILEFALHVLSSPMRSDANDVAIALVGAAERFPDEVAAYITPYLHHNQIWTRVGAWACVLATGKTYFSIDDLVLAFQDLPLFAKARHTSLLGGLAIDGKGQDLLVGFASRAVSTLLDCLPAARADEIIQGVFGGEHNYSVGMVLKVNEILQNYNRAYSAHGKRSLTAGFFGEFDALAYDAAYKAMFRKMLGGIASRIGGQMPAVPRDTPLIYLSAFLMQVNFWKIPGSDVWEFRDDIFDSAVDSLMRVVAACSGLDGEGLARDANCFLAQINQSEPNAQPWALDHLIQVDVPDLELAAAKTINVDWAAVEKCLYHGADWVVPLATELLAEAAEHNQILPIVERAISTGHSSTLWAAAQLSTKLDSGIVADLFMTRLCKGSVPGSEYLFEAIADRQPKWTSALESALRTGLLSKPASVAKVAAKLAASLTPEPSGALRSLLEQSYAYWLQYEEPYPTNGGVVPTTPRPEIAQALQSHGGIADDVLLQMLGDRHGDVAEFARKGAFERASISAAFATQLVQDIISGALSPNLLRKLLQANVQLPSDQFERIFDLLKSDNPKLRLAAAEVLDGAHFPADRAQAALSLLADDQELEIREIGTRIARRLKQKVES